MEEESLGHPPDVEALYIARGDEVEPYRPVIQGDVFRGLRIPGVPPSDAVMLVAHPCTMRRGAVLVERLAAIPVTDYQRLPMEQWPIGHTRVFPLPELMGSDTHHAGRFIDIGMLAEAEVLGAERIAILSELGVLLFQQRYVHDLTRVIMSLDLLRSASVHVFEEVELQERWNDDLARPQVENGADLSQTLQHEAVEFDAYMQTDLHGRSLRDCLTDENSRAAVRRAVAEEVSRRLQ